MGAMERSLNQALGAYYPKCFAPTEDVTDTTIDDTATGSYRVNTAYSPFSIAGLIFKMARNDTYCQLFIGTANKAIGYRVKSEASPWSEWSKIV